MASRPDIPAIWFDVPWTAELVADVPESATWPRIMSDPHPRAVGSYGAEFIDWWYENPWDPRYPRPRWWQELAATRILEHDALGRLVWLVWLLTLARQQGKGVILQGLALWRMEKGPDLFGEIALVLHVANKTKISREIQAPARGYARRMKWAGWAVREESGNEQITHPNGGRWVCAASGSTYGFSASLAFADEAWEIDPAVIDMGVEPTQLEREQPQLGLISTAHPEATALFIDRRRSAIAGAEDMLILEWSALPNMSVDDRAGWRMASPHWTPQREAMLARALTTARTQPALSPGELDPVLIWRSQYANIWPERFSLTSGVAEDPGDPLLDAPLPEGDSDDVDDWTFAIEDYAGLSTAVAAAGRTADGQIIVQGFSVASRAEAFRWAADQASSAVLVGPALVESGEAAELEQLVAVKPMHTTDTRAGLALIRHLVADGGIIAPGGDQLGEQVGRARVKAGPAGLSVVSAGRWDVLRAACWAVLAVDSQRQHDPAAH